MADDSLSVSEVERISETNDRRYKAVDFINSELGINVKTLHKIEDIVSKLHQDKEDLNKKLEFLTSTSSDQISDAINNAQTKLKEVQQVEETADEILAQLSPHRKKVSALIECVEDHLNIIHQHERVMSYQHWVTSIQQLSSEMSTLTGINNESTLLDRYHELEEYKLSLTGNTACTNLKDYVYKMHRYWHSKLLQDFSKEYESVLMSLHYPFVNDSASRTPPPPSLYERLASLTHHLLMLSDEHDGDEKSDVLHRGLITDFPPLITPLKLLLKPLEVRFLYHFSGDKKTNSSSHPEWCLTKVLSWITEHSNFFAKHIQPVLNKSSYSHLSAKVEISRGLVKLLLLKLADDMPVLLEDEDLFSHCLQETLNFDRELRQNAGYPVGQPSVLGVLTQPQVLTHWINLERKYSVALMDELVSMPGAWDCAMEETDGVSACGEHLVTLLQGVTDRYSTLPQPGHRLQFLEVQLDVLDEFRVRAAQIARECCVAPVTSHYPAILSTLKHVSDTLEDWSDLPMFLELQMLQERQKEMEEAAEAFVSLEKKSPRSPCVSVGVFTPCLSLYRHMVGEMVLTILSHLMASVRNASVNYRRNKWFVEPTGGRRESLNIDDVTPSFCPLLEILVSELSSLRKSLTVSLFDSFWKDLARDIDKYLYEEVVLQNHFSSLGAAQLQHDMKKALYPVFAEYSAKPHSHFIHIEECCRLLTMPRATAMLLRDTLHHFLYESSTPGVSSVIKPAEALVEHDITKLNVEQAYTVLNRRTNMANF